jgi:hypothetical protein
VTLLSPTLPGRFASSIEDGRGLRMTRALHTLPYTDAAGVGARTVGIQSHAARRITRVFAVRFVTAQAKRGFNSTVDTKNSVCIIRSHRFVQTPRFSRIFTNFSTQPPETSGLLALSFPRPIPQERARRRGE